MTSPEYVRVSMASAIALRLRSGRFGAGVSSGGINVLLNYAEGCQSDCGYCGLARSRRVGGDDRSFIRVEWPLVETARLAERMAEHESELTRICVSMVTHGHAFTDTCEIARRLTAAVHTPLSILVAPPGLNRERLLVLREAGADMIGVGLDAVTEGLFRSLRTDVPAGGLRWEKYWDILAEAREIFGPWKVNAHTVAGLGESDRDLITIFAQLRNREIFSYLFSFNPEPESRMAGHPQPDLTRWRRIQLARELIETEGYGPDRFEFDDRGGLTGVRAGRAELDRVTGAGAAFLTGGCPGAGGEPGCTRPYGSYRPGEPFGDYPFQPGPADLALIGRQLRLDEVTAGPEPRTRKVTSGCG